eukprot:1625524-Amphidinium_carterae.1
MAALAAHCQDLTGLIAEVLWSGHVHGKAIHDAAMHRGSQEWRAAACAASQDWHEWAKGPRRR